MIEDPQRDDLHGTGRVSDVDPKLAEALLARSTASRRGV